MKILHTADWHLGQTFYGYDRSHEHQAFLDWLLVTIEQSNVDVLLISGDVFDVANPSAKSQKQLYRFLTQVNQRCPKLETIITAGNHDSAARLEAPKVLLETLNVQIIGQIPKNEQREIDYQQLLFPIGGQQPKAWVLATPFPRLGDYPSKRGESLTYTDGVTRLYQEAYQVAREIIGDQTPLIAMGHLHATGVSTSSDDRSERVIIGGVEFVPSTAFDEGLAYIALGHIHKPQKVGGRENLRYSGSPLPMSFTERGYKHQVVLVELGELKVKTITPLFIPITAELKQIPTKPSSLPEVLEQLEQIPTIEEGHTDHRQYPYLEIQVQLTAPEPSLKAQITKALEGKQAKLAKISLIYPKSSQAQESRVHSYEDLQSLTPQGLFQDIYKRKFNTEPSPEIQKRFQEVILELEAK